MNTLMVLRVAVLSLAPLALVVIATLIVVRPLRTPSRGMGPKRST